MPALLDGDRRFEAVDARRDPGALEPGVLSEGINISLDNSEIETRRGMHPLPGLTAEGLNLPATIPAEGVNFISFFEFGTTYGATPFTAVNGEDYFVLALERYAIRCHPSGTVELIQYPLKPRDCLTDTVTDQVEFVQAYDKLFMFRGTSLQPWVWDGKETLGNVPAKFVPVASKNSTEPSVESIPQSDLAIYYLNRLWVLKGKDEIVYSDIGVETDYNLTNSFKIDQGAFGRVNGMKAWGDNAIIVFKEKSVDALENLQGDLTLNGTRTRLTNEIGLASPSCITDVGNDLWFLSERGVYSISQALDNKLQSNSQPISSPLEPLFKRINWSVKSQFRSAFWDNSYYLAVSIDNATTNNVIFVYSFITQSWHGYHTSSIHDSQRMFVNFQNKEKFLFTVTNDGIIYRMYSGFEDQGILQAFDINEIEWTAKTRGYGVANPERKQYRSVSYNISEWNPSYTVTAETDGVNEAYTLQPSPTTRSRKKYHTVAAVDYDVTNANNDHGLPYREDYSVAYSQTGAGDSGTVVEDYNYFATGVDNGSDLNKMQRVDDKRTLDMRGDYITYKFEGTQGRCKVHSVETKAFTHNRTATLQA